MSTAALAFSSMCDCLIGIEWGTAGGQSNEINVLCACYSCLLCTWDGEGAPVPVWVICTWDPPSLPEETAHALAQPRPLIMSWVTSPWGCSHLISIGLGSLRQLYCKKFSKWELEDGENISGFLRRESNPALHGAGNHLHFSELLLYLNQKNSLVSWIIYSIPVQMSPHVLALQCTSLKHMI